MKQIEIERFWRFCAERGVTSKKLLLKTRASSVTPFTLVAGEPIRYGSPVITVPYAAVVNAQTVRGSRRLRSLPPYSAMMRFLTRRSRMSRMSAEQVWLAAFAAVYRNMVLRCDPDGSAPPLAPLFSLSIQPDLPSLFTASHAAECPAIGVHSQALLDDWQGSVEHQQDLAWAMIRFFQKKQGRKCFSPTEKITRSDLQVAYRTVMHRALLLPLNCELSVPSSLPEFLEASPDCPLLPSFVPVIDMIRAAQGNEEDNCLLYTCAKSDFVSPSTRRRILMETSPLSSRRVVAVATRDIKEGAEILLGVEW